MLFYIKKLPENTESSNIYLINIFINKIENRRTMPSMTGFFYICEYLGIEPQAFFDTKTISPTKAAEIVEQIGKLSSEKADHILEVIKDLAEK